MQGVVVVYDVSDPLAFDDVQYWMQEIFRNVCLRVQYMSVYRVLLHISDTHM